MGVPKLAYVCTDQGIAPDGAKGASVHYREMGQALVESGVDVEAVVRRAPRLPFDRFPLQVANQTERRDRRAMPHDPVATELEALIDQSGVLRALERTAPVDAVYERYSITGLAGLAYARRHHVPFVLEVNAPLWEEAHRYRSLSLVNLAHAVATELFTHATHILAVSEAMERRVVAEGADPSRVHVFPNGVNARFLKATQAARAPQPLTGKKLLVFVGSLKPWHGVEFLLDAFLAARSDDVGLWIVGDGPLRSAVEAAARKHPNRIVYEGAVDHEDIPHILQAADAVVAPYTNESPDYFCPLKVVEALATGVPILAARVPAVRDLGVDAADIRWFKADSVSDFDRALRALFSHLPQARRAARNNRAIARDHFTWQRRVTQLCDLLDWQIAATAKPVGVG